MPAMPEDPKPRDHEYVVALPSFEGPLDLLLHLIQKHELDIFDIPVSFVTEKYLQYINLMETLSIDIASEYLVMAATLAHIKSKSLLPEEPAGQEDVVEGEDDLDPREELIRRLLEYQKYKHAAAELNERGALGRDVFLRGGEAPVAEGPAPLAPVPIWNLLDAFAKVLSRAKVDLQHEVSFDRMSITDRITQLMGKLAGRKQIRFEELFDGQRTRFDLIITFLAVLEMTRLKMTRLYQPDPLADIFIEPMLAPADAAPEEGQEAQSSSSADMVPGEGQSTDVAPEEEEQDAASSFVDGAPEEEQEAASSFAEDAAEEEHEVPLASEEGEAEEEQQAQDALSSSEEGEAEEEPEAPLSSAGEPGEEHESPSGIDATREDEVENHDVGSGTAEREP